MARYEITSDRGKQQAESMRAGESWTNPTDKSVWTKNADGTVSVTTAAGNTHNNAYTPDTGGSTTANTDVLRKIAQPSHYEQKNGEYSIPGSSYEHDPHPDMQATNIVDPYAATNDAARNSALWTKAKTDTTLSDAARKQIQEGLHQANLKLIEQTNPNAVYDAASGTYKNVSPYANQVSASVTNSSNITQGKTRTPWVYTANGDKYIANITNGRTTYTDDRGITHAVGNGDWVVDAYGRVWRMGEGDKGEATGYTSADQFLNDWYASNSTTHAAEGEQELIQLKDQLLEAIRAQQEAQQQQVQAATEEEISKVKTDMDAALRQYNQQLDQQAVAKAQAADNLALRNAAAGDTGGIGQKRYSDQQAAYDAQALSIQLEAQNLINTTNQLVAQYRAQGQYQLAQVALEYAQAKYDALMDQAKMAYNYDALLDSQQQQADETAYNRALQRIKLGLFSQADAEAIGYSPGDAQRLVILAQTDPATAVSEVSRGGTRGRTSSGASGGANDLNSFLASNIRGYGDRYSEVASSLGSYMINQTNTVNADGTNADKHYNVAKALRNNVKNGDINLAGYAMLMRQIGAPDYEIMDDINYYNTTGSFPD